MTKFSINSNTGYLKMIKTSSGLNFVDLGLTCKIKSSQIILEMGNYQIRST